MKSRLLIPVFVCFLFSASAISAQEARSKIAVVSLIDTMLTHVYGNKWYASAFEKDIYDYGQHTIDGLTKIMGEANISVTEVQIPEWINRMSLKNVLDKPSKGLQKWMKILKEDLDVDYLVMVVKKFEPENKVSHRFLNGRQYGIGTYANYPDAISLFSFVGYYIFSLDQGREIQLNTNHDCYLLMDIRLDKRMSFKELIDLPEKYLDTTTDQMQLLVDTRNLEIKRTILEDLILDR
jgi:hypothetical protein